MFALVLIVALGLTPPLFSLLAVRHNEERFQARLRAAREIAILHPVARRLDLPFDGPEADYIPGVGYIIGDISCAYNARSPHLRCAVNPAGPCAGCRQYAPREDAIAGPPAPSA